jgi:hypothetical protein
LKATGQLTLTCSDTYNGDAIYVNLEPEGPISVNLNLACYGEFPYNDAFQDGINQL